MDKALAIIATATVAFIAGIIVAPKRTNIKITEYRDLDKNTQNDLRVLRDHPETVLVVLQQKLQQLAEGASDYDIEFTQARIAEFQKIVARNARLAAMERADDIARAVADQLREDLDADGHRREEPDFTLPKDITAGSEFAAKL